MLDKVRSKRKNGEHNAEELILSRNLRCGRKTECPPSLPAGQELNLDMVTKANRGSLRVTLTVPLK